MTERKLFEIRNKKVYFPITQNEPVITIKRGKFYAALEAANSYGQYCKLSKLPAV